VWRKLHDEELYDLYCSPYIVRVTTSGRMGWVGHVARMGERIYIYIFPHQNPVYIYIYWKPSAYIHIYTGFWWGNVREKDNLEELELDGKIILRLIIRKWDVGV